MFFLDKPNKGLNIRMRETYLYPMSFLAQSIRFLDVILSKRKRVNLFKNYIVALNLV